MENRIPMEPKIAAAKEELYRRLSGLAICR